MSDFEVKVTDLQKIMVKFLVKVLEAKHSSGELRCPETALILKAVSISFSRYNPN